MSLQITPAGQYEIDKAAVSLMVTMGARVVDEAMAPLSEPFHRNEGCIMAEISTDGTAAGIASSDGWLYPPPHFGYRAVRVGETFSIPLPTPPASGTLGHEDGDPATEVERVPVCMECGRNVSYNDDTQRYEHYR